MIPLPNLAIWPKALWVRRVSPAQHHIRRWQLYFILRLVFQPGLWHPLKIYVVVSTPHSLCWPTTENLFRILSMAFREYQHFQHLGWAKKAIICKKQANFPCAINWHKFFCNKDLRHNNFTPSLAENSVPKPGVVGSNPTGCTACFLDETDCFPDVFVVFLPSGTCSFDINRVPGISPFRHRKGTVEGTAGLGLGSLESVRAFHHFFRCNFFQVGGRHFLPQSNGSIGSEMIALRRQMGSFYNREIGDRFGAFHQAIVYDRNLSSRDGDPNGAPLAYICL